MQRFLILILLLCTAPGIQGQSAAKKQPATQQSRPKKPPVAGLGYSYPVQNVAGFYSANFGEMRPGHFHAGVDIKTDGTEGHPLIALTDGYISRVTVTPGGYGRALYLVLRDGRTAVYGHISRFRDDIEKRIDAERRNKRSNNADLWFAAGQLPVQQGETIARSGNSGTSFGPHLHFELRDTSGCRLNTVRMGIFQINDDIPPIIMRLHYVEIDTLRGVPVHAPLQTYHAALIGGGRYQLLHEGPVEAGRKGYFILEASDRRNGVQNTFGVYRTRLSVDSVTRFEYRMDGIPSGYSRFCNAIAYYPLQITSRNEVLRLAQLSDAPRHFYPQMQERGLIRTTEGQTCHIRIEVEDDCGNLSTLEFDLFGHPVTFRADSLDLGMDSTSVILHPNRATTVGLGNELTARIPAGAIYEPLFCRPQRLGTHTTTEGVAILSPSYQVLDATTPLHREMTVSIRAFVPRNTEAQTALAARTRSGELAYIGGKYANGAMTARTTTTGELLVVADTLPPTLTPLFKAESDLSKVATLRFRIADNFSGIASYSLHINGEWVACERFPTKGTLVHTFTNPTQGRRHDAELQIGDGCGNITEWKGTFYR